MRATASPGCERGLRSNGWFAAPWLNPGFAAAPLARSAGGAAGHRHLASAHSLALPPVDPGPGAAVEGGGGCRVDPLSRQSCLAVLVGAHRLCSQPRNPCQPRLERHHSWPSRADGSALRWRPSPSICRSRRVGADDPDPSAGPGPVVASLLIAGCIHAERRNRPGSSGRLGTVQAEDLPPS